MHTLEMLCYEILTRGDQCLKYMNFSMGQCLLLHLGQNFWKDLFWNVVTIPSMFMYLEVGEDPWINQDEEVKRSMDKTFEDEELMGNQDDLLMKWVEIWRCMWRLAWFSKSESYVSKTMCGSWGTFHANKYVHGKLTNCRVLMSLNVFIVGYVIWIQIVLL